MSVYVPPVKASTSQKKKTSFAGIIKHVGVF